eukprot:Em0021g480a
MITHSTRLESFSVCFLCSAAFAEKAAEHRKHTENDPKCVELGKRCILLAVESYGPGDQRQRAFSQVATRLAIRGNTLKSKVVAKLYGRLSLLLEYFFLNPADRLVLVDKWSRCSSAKLGSGETCKLTSGVAFVATPEVNFSAPSPERKVQPPGRMSSNECAPRAYIESVFSQRWQSPTIRFVPKRARLGFAKVLSSVLKEIISDNSVTSWLKLMMLPKCVLPSCQRRGHHNKPVPIEFLCDFWMQNQFNELWNMALSRVSSTTNHHRTKTISPKQQILSAISLAQDDLYSKACQTLVSSGLAPNNAETWRLLEAKHPKAEINLMAILRSFPKLTAARPSGLRIQHLINAAEVPLQTPILHLLRAVINLLAAVKVRAQQFFHPFQFGVACPLGAEQMIHGLRDCIEQHWLENDFVVLKVDQPSLNLMAILRSFPKLSAAGPSGLRIQHLIDAAEVPLQTPILQLLRKVINILASGKAPADVSIFLAGGNLTALQKSKPDCPLDVRPIAVGEALRRLVGKCLCSMVKVKAAEFFDPLQRGVACAAGAEKIAHGLRDYIDENWHVEGFTVLKIDLVNAFNLSYSRGLVGVIAGTLFCGTPWEIYQSQSGVQQGDPMGPLLFSLVLNVVIKVIATHPECCDLCYHVWYLDDGVLAGPSSHVRKALDLLMELGPPLGLRVNIKKCEVFSSGCLAHFPIEMKQSSKPNLEILGIPIGDADFCSAVLDRKRSEAGFLLKRLEDVGQVDPPGIIRSLGEGGFGGVLHVSLSPSHVFIQAQIYGSV